MAKKSAKVRTTFNILNIKLRQPDAKESTATQYADLFIKTGNQRKKIKIAPDLGAILWRCIRERVNGREIIFGYITRYTIIQNGRWLDLEDPNAEETDVEIPAGMAANSKQTPFFFVPANHRLALKKGVGTLTPKQAALFFERAFGQAIDKEQHIDIDIAPSEQQYQRIVESKSLSRLDIKLTYANNDMSGDFAALIQQQLIDTNSGSWHIIATAEKGELLDVSKSSVLTGALDLARNNGEVEATEQGPSGRKRKIEPTSAPLKETIVSAQPSELLSDVSNRLLEMYPRPANSPQDE